MYTAFPYAVKMILLTLHYETIATTIVTNERRNGVMNSRNGVIPRFHETSFAIFIQTMVDSDKTILRIQLTNNNS